MQVVYGESIVLVSALFIACREYEARLARPELSVIHDETRVQLAVATDMLHRLMGTMP